jgi:hypothetical protein
MHSATARAALIAGILTLAAGQALAADAYVQVGEHEVVNLARVDAVEYHQAQDSTSKPFFRLVIYFSGTKEPYTVDYPDEKQARDGWAKLMGAMGVKAK